MYRYAKIKTLPTADLCPGDMQDRCHILQVFLLRLCDERKTRDNHLIIGC